MPSYSSKIGGFDGGAGQIVLANGPPYDQIVLGRKTVVGYWPLYEDVGAATAERDYTSGGRNLVVTGTPTEYTSPAPGGQQKALSFTAAGQYLAPGGTALNIASGEVEFWVKLSANPATSTNKALLFGLVESSSKYDKVLYLNAAGTLTFACQVAAGTVATATSANFPIGRWNHVLGVQNGINLVLYVNGVAGSNGSQGNSRTDFASANVYVGGTGSSFGFIDCPGVYSQVAAYSGTPAMSASDVAYHYNYGQGYLPNSGARVTSLRSEVIRQGATARQARVTTVRSEVARTGIAGRQGRVTTLVAEVLRSQGIGYSVAATDTIHVLGSSTKTREGLASASDTIHVLGSSAGSRAVYGSASDTILISPVAAAVREIVAAATDGIAFTDLAGDFDEVPLDPQTYILSASDTFNLSQESSEMGLFPKSASDGVTVADGASALVGHTYSVGATDTVHLADFGDISAFRLNAHPILHIVGHASAIVGHNYRLSVGDRIAVDGRHAAARDTTLRVAATSGIRVLDSSADAGQTLLRIDAADAMTLADEADAVRWTHLRGVAVSTVALSTTGAERADLARPASSAVALIGHLSPGRAIPVAATTALQMSLGSLPRGRFLSLAAEGILDVSDASFSGIGWRNGRDGIAFAGHADARASLAGSGSSTVLMSGVSGDYPMSFAETPGGLILIADGVDPMIRWDGLAATAGTAGLGPPGNPVMLGGMNVGTITGRRVAYCRFVDDRGNVSNLSPVSNEVDFGRDALIDSIAVNPGTAAVTVRSDGHGLVTGDAVVVGGVEGMVGINGTQVVTVLDEDTFRLNGAVSSGVYKGGAYWIWGVAQVVYQNLPTPADPKVVRRQILRNLAGDGSTFYVDIDTDDLTSATLVSTADDVALAAGLPVPLFFDDDIPNANRYGVPPSHKAVLAAHLGRIFATGDVTYREGSCAVTTGSLQVRGVATSWRANFAGRLIYPAGATQAYEIAAVDEAAQVLILTAPYRDATNRFAPYAIRSAPGERKLVYYSEPALPEAWPPWNAIALPEDSDEIVGLMSQGSFLYVLERRHVYRFTFQTDPATDGFLFLSTMRGCINNRCHVQVESASYLLDETGVYTFDGSEASPVSGPIQTLFQLDGSDGPQVDWSADQTLWHAAHDPVRDTIRWFVHFVGDDQIRHALCYDYRLRRWWIEQYPTAITASTVGTIGYRRSLVGTTGRRVLCLSEGPLDYVAPQDGLRGTATGGTDTTLVDSAGAFPDGLADVPVTIVSGTLRGQTRMVAASTADTLEVVEPWNGTPDATCVYQVGGVPWSWRSGWLRHADDEADNPRDVEVVFQPLRSGSTLDISLYYDHSDEPRVWAYSRTQDGVTTQADSPYVEIDLTTGSGWAQHRLTGHSDRYATGDRFVAVGLSGVQGGDVVRVFQVGVSGAKGGV